MPPRGEKRPAPRRRCWIHHDPKERRIPGRDTNLTRPLRPILEENWRLVIEAPPPELDALDTGPGEARNAAVRHPDIVERLQRKFRGGTELRSITQAFEAYCRVATSGMPAISKTEITACRIGDLC